MMASVLLLLALCAQGVELGGHEPQVPAAPSPARADQRAEVLEEMWQRRVLAPDLSSWAPGDMDVLEKIRRAEPEALEYLKRKFGGVKPWTTVKRDLAWPRVLLTKPGYDKYLLHLSQDALEYFQSKGTGAKWALKMTDLEGKRLFSADGRLTPAGVDVYGRAKLNHEVFWRAPNGETFGTRRPRSQFP
ncbi:MAG: hypothetical protein AAB036_01765 [Elusimicrobiota bacterium]